MKEFRGKIIFKEGYKTTKAISTKFGILVRSTGIRDIEIKVTDVNTAKTLLGKNCNDMWYEELINGMWVRLMWKTNNMWGLPQDK